jgi:uncharacterized tellurite resistance protein B-like protein
MPEPLEDIYTSTYEGFILYLYLCAAYSDYQLKETERHMIREKMSKSGLLQADNFDQHWYEVYMLFKSHNDYASEQYIERTCKELGIDKSQRLKIYNDLKDIIDADGHEDASEKVNMFKFKKMLNV